MQFRFANKIGDETIITHSAEALKAMITKHGVHLVYDYENGTNDADSGEYRNVEALLQEFPNVKREDAEAFFQGKQEIYDVRVNDYLVSIQYPIPDIGYE